MNEVITSESYDIEDDSLASRSVQPNDTTSLTQSIKRMLYAPVDVDELHPVTMPTAVLPEYESIFEIAGAKGLTVKEFVHEDPAFALRLAENSCAVWQNLLTMAAVRGTLPVEVDGRVQEYAVSRNQTRLIEVRVRESNAQLKYVSELMLTAYKDNDQRTDALERSMCT